MAITNGFYFSCAPWCDVFATLQYRGEETLKLSDSEQCNEMIDVLTDIHTCQVESLRAYAIAHNETNNKETGALLPRLAEELIATGHGINFDPSRLLNTLYVKATDEEFDQCIGKFTAGYAIDETGNLSFNDLTDNPLGTEFGIYFMQCDNGAIKYRLKTKSDITKTLYSHYSGFLGPDEDEGCDLVNAYLYDFVMTVLNALLFIMTPLADNNTFLSPRRIVSSATFDKMPIYDRLLQFISADDTFREAMCDDAYAIECTTDGMNLYFTMKRDAIAELKTMNDTSGKVNKRSASFLKNTLNLLNCDTLTHALTKEGTIQEGNSVFEIYNPEETENGEELVNPFNLMYIPASNIHMMDPRASFTSVFNVAIWDIDRKKQIHVTRPDPDVLKMILGREPNEKISSIEAAKLCQLLFMTLENLIDINISEHATGDFFGSMSFANFLGIYDKNDIRSDTEETRA